MELKGIIAIIVFVVVVGIIVYRNLPAKNRKTSEKSEVKHPRDTSFTT